MRVCRNCTHINGDTDTRCRRCGTEIGEQLRLPPSASVPRPTPDVLIRRNRNYLLLLLLIPLVAILILSFWVGFIPTVVRTSEHARSRELAANRQMIRKALEACRHDTGGVPGKRLAVLRQYGVVARDLTPGADPRKWAGPYLPTDQPFPVNPYHPRDGAAGWRYRVVGNSGYVEPTP